MGPNSWMVVHGSGAGHETLTKYVVGRNAAMIVDDDLHDLSLQGPVAVDFLAKHVPGIRDLKYFHHMPATLVRPPRDDFAHRLHRRARLRDLLQGRRRRAHLGHHPRAKASRSASFPPASPRSIGCGSRAICCSIPTTCPRCIPSSKDPPGDSLWELGLDFTVSPGQERLSTARMRTAGSKGKERFKIFGLLVDGKAPADMGDPVYSGDKKVGVVTCAMVSTLDRQVDGHRAPRRSGRGPRHEAGDSRQERQGPGDGAHAAVRRSGKEEAHGGGLSSECDQGGSCKRSS